MRVDHLIIITFPKAGEKNDPETVHCGTRLYDKYKSRDVAPVQSIRVIQVWHPKYGKTVKDLTPELGGDFGTGNDRVYKVVHGTALTDGKVEEAVATSGNVGVYIVCHGFGRRPTVFAGQGPGSGYRMPNWDNRDFARAIANLLIELGLKQVRKVCLVMCGVENDSKGDPHLMILLGEELKGKLASPAMVAGYDCYVSVIGGGGKEIAERGTVAKENPTILKKHKQVYVVDKGLVSAEAGWSDKS